MFSDYEFRVEICDLLPKTNIFGYKTECQIIYIALKIMVLPSPRISLTPGMKILMEPQSIIKIY